MQALWGEPWTARSVFVDGSEVVPFRGDVKDPWRLAKQCTVTQWRQGPVERRRKWWPPRVLTRPFRRWGFDSSHWLFSRCFRAPSPNTTERSQSINGHKSRKRNLGRQSSISCAWKNGKERQCLSKKSRSSLSQRAAEHLMQWVKKQKNRALAQAFFREEIIVNAKPKEGKVEVRDLRGIWLDRCGHKAKRSDARFIYIYIYREWRKSKSTRNCGARWGSPQLRFSCGVPWCKLLHSAFGQKGYRLDPDDRRLSHRRTGPCKKAVFACLTTDVK